jgi:crossover junction endodeoxyribonuclease RuvC
METQMKILGIDPGLQVCGYAVMKSIASGESLTEAGVLRTDSDAPLESRLHQIGRDIETLLEKFRPSIVAVEELYSHYNHPKTAILMGHARGVILEKAAEAAIEVRSFSATRIKKSITGNGRASKEQIQKTVQMILGLPELPEPNDVADAIAVAMCCSNSKTVVS